MKYQNPILRGFHPDPSICTDGLYYYLVTSSFEYVPGIPIYRSIDLVNWEQIGNAITSEDQLSLADACESGGIWAPTIRYHKKTKKFYITATVDGRGNMILSTDDVLSNWSVAKWVNVDGIDPSIYFENDDAYYCTNGGDSKGLEEGIFCVKINIDTGELLEEGRVIWNGTGEGYLEAPHIYLINGWYYLMASEGGTFSGHMITIARSKNIYGPYENCPFNPILTNRNDTTRKVQNSGHGDLIQDINGNWWIVHLGIRLARRTMSQLGRETFLVPVIWENEWPLVPNRKADLEYENSLLTVTQHFIEKSTDFSTPEWEPWWLFPRKIPKSYTRGNGLILKSYNQEPLLALTRPVDFDCICETVLNSEEDIDTQFDGAESGLIIYLQTDMNYRLVRRKEFNQFILVLEKRCEDFFETVYKMPIEKGRIVLTVYSTRESYRFIAKTESGKIINVGTASSRFLSCEMAGRCFTGTLIGLIVKGKIASFESFLMKKQ